MSNQPRTSRRGSRGGSQQAFSGPQIEQVNRIVNEALTHSGIRPGRNRFPSTPYAELPVLQIDKGGVSTVLSILDTMTHGEAKVAAIALAYVIANHQGDQTGYALKKFTDFTLAIGPVQIATTSAQRYLDLAPQMDSRKAEATAELCWTELQVLRYLQGGAVNWKALTSTLEFAASRFREYDCTKREGSARSLLAFIHLVHWQQLQAKRNVPEGQATAVYRRMMEELTSAIVLIGTGYAIKGATEMVQQFGQGTVSQTLSGSSSRGARHSDTRSPAHA